MTAVILTMTLSTVLSAVDLADLITFSVVVVTWPMALPAVPVTLFIASSATDLAPLYVLVMLIQTYKRHDRSHRRRVRTAILTREVRSFEREQEGARRRQDRHHLPRSLTPLAHHSKAPARNQAWDLISLPRVSIPYPICRRWSHSQSRRPFRPRHQRYMPPPGTTTPRMEHGLNQGDVSRPWRIREANHYKSFLRDHVQFMFSLVSFL